MNILDLNEYVILKIFELCTNNDLENLYDVCKYFRDIIESRMYYVRSLNLLLCGHNNNPINCRRTSSQLSYRDRINISDNWINGRYTEQVYFNHYKFYPSKIYLDNEHFYMTHTGMLRIHKRSKTNYFNNNNRNSSNSKNVYNDDIIERKIYKEIGSPIKSDVSDFKKHNNLIFAGRTCGKCFLYDQDNDDISEHKLHMANEYLMSVEFYDNIFVTSTDKLCKIWYKITEFDLIDLEFYKEFKENFKCLSVLPKSKKIIGGKYMDLGRFALREIDIETGTLEILNSNSLSIYDLKNIDENQLLTGHFDTTLRLYDRRTGRDELIWTDPYDSSIYCLEYDGLYGVLCGMKYNCRVNLYDIRIPQKFVQMYFPIHRKNLGSPVYSITCDCRYLYIATDHNLREWDFKSSWAECRDYRNVFKNL